MPALLALLAAALIMAGCGESAVSSGKAAGGQPSSSVSADEDVSATTATDTPQSTAAVNEMSVFVRPRTDADVLPSRLSYRLRPEGRCTDRQRADFGCPGDPIADESRLLLSGLGVGKTSLYAWPTTTGAVCWAWDDGAGACAHDFARGETRAIYMGIDPDDEGVGAPGTLLGVVPDDVVAVDVQVRGEQQAAVVQSNGFFYELPDGSCTNWAFESFTVRYRNGSADTVSIEWHQGREELPETCPG